MNIFTKIILICALTIPLNAGATHYYDELPMSSVTMYTGDVFAVPAYDELKDGDFSVPPVYGLRPFASLDSMTLSLISSVHSPIGVWNEITFDLFSFTYQFTADTGADVYFTVTDPAILSLFLDGWEDFNIITNKSKYGWTLFGIDISFEGRLASIPEPLSWMLFLLATPLFRIIRRRKNI